MDSQDIMPKAIGFVNAYLHKDDAKFVQVGKEENQGYYEIPKENILQEMHVKNLIVNIGSTFVSRRMKPGTTWGSGIQYLELGTGVGTGTTQSPEPESTTQTALRKPLIRKAISSWTYLDANGASTTLETNKIEITTNFIESEANGALVEMGLFGGEATTTIGSGYMFNYKVFSVWNKDNTMQLTVKWQLTF